MLIKFCLDENLVPSINVIPFLFSPENLNNINEGTLCLIKFIIISLKEDIKIANFCFRCNMLDQIEEIDVKAGLLIYPINDGTFAYFSY